MATIDDVKRELNASIITLMRRRDSTADPAEKATIVDAIADLNGQLRMLNQAAVLQDAHSAADATTILERAVAAAKLGPFDGYHAALEAHLKNFSVLAGKTLAGESLERALMAPARARAVVGGKKAKQGKTAKGKKA